MAFRFLRAGRPRTLKAQLLWWLVPALVLIMLGALWLSNHQLRNQVDIAYDRSLAGALRTIDHNISTASGGLAMEQPYLMLEFFELTANGRVYYRVATEDGLAEIGNPALPLPARPLISGEPQFFYADYQGETLRVAALARPMDPPLYNNYGGRVVVQVAESLDTRQAFIHQVLWRSIERDVTVLAMSILIAVAGVVLALRPLSRLQAEVKGRSPDDLSPVNASEIPGEVRPLVDAVNLHMARFADQARLQRQFLDDASHHSYVRRCPFCAPRSPMRCARQTPRKPVQPLWRCRRGWTGPCAPPTKCWPWRGPETPLWGKGPWPRNRSS